MDGAMPKAYRFCFFDGDLPQAAAVLVIRFSSDRAATEEAIALLSASAMHGIEVWRGTRRVFRHGRVSTRAPCTEQPWTIGIAP